MLRFFQLGFFDYEEQKLVARSREFIEQEVVKESRLEEEGSTQQSLLSSFAGLINSMIDSVLSPQFRSQYPGERPWLAKLRS